MMSLTRDYLTKTWMIGTRLMGRAASVERCRFNESHDKPQTPNRPAYSPHRGPCDASQHAGTMSSCHQSIGGLKTWNLYPRCLTPDRSPTEPGFVYAMMLHDGIVKIGYSINPQRRAREIAGVTARNLSRLVRRPRRRTPPGTRELSHRSTRGLLAKRRSVGSGSKNQQKSREIESGITLSSDHTGRPAA